ncbi:MAG TPA: twin-arginine translocase TatA/TatE family subunit [Chthoniobacterales bacterium]
MNLLASILNLFDGPQGIFILLIVLLLFGAKKLPELARGMGQAIREFQKAKDEAKEEDAVVATKPVVPQIETVPTDATAVPDPVRTAEPRKPVV